MPSLSFRAKLFLAMTLIVVGVTAAALIVTGRRVEQTYHRLEEQQFDRRMVDFSRLQKIRLDEVARTARGIAQSVRLAGAVEEGDPEVIYRLLTTEIEELLGRSEEVGSEGGEGGGGGGGGSARRFYCVLDAGGRVIDPPASRPEAPGRAKLTSGQTAILRRSLDAAGSDRDLQQFGYLALGTEPGGSRLHQLVVTPIVSRATGERLGALVLGSPFKEMEANDQFPLGGLWLEGHVHSVSLPEDARGALAASVDAGIRAGRLTSDFPFVVGGLPYRAFFQVLNPRSPFPPAAHVGLYPLAASLKELRDLRVQIGGVGALAFAAALGVILLTSRGLTGPIKDLVAGTNRIRRGDFTVRVPVRARDEMGDLAASFNEMASGLALTRKYHTLLGQVTDPQVAERLLSGEGAAVLGGEVREVSVLFCDIRGFTAMTEKMPPAEVVALLNEHMTLLTRVVHAHRGVVDKFVGDLLMAVFGAPEDHGDEAPSAVRCASGMIAAREALNAASPISVTVGIGIASGPALAGCVGSSDRLDYTVMGAPVNLASRLCDQAESGEVLFDQTTRERLGAEIAAAPLDALTLKGFSEPVRAWKLVRVLSPRPFVA